MSFDELIGVGAALRQVDVIHPMIVLLHTEVPLLAVDQKLRKVVEFGNDLSYIRHFACRVVEAIGKRRKQPVWYIELPSLQHPTCFSIGIAANQVLQHNRKIRIMEAVMELLL